MIFVVAQLRIPGLPGKLSSRAPQHFLAFGRTPENHGWVWARLSLAVQSTHQQEQLVNVSWYTPLDTYDRVRARSEQDHGG